MSFCRFQCGPGCHDIIDYITSLPNSSVGLSSVTLIMPATFFGAGQGGSLPGFYCDGDAIEFLGQNHLQVPASAPVWQIYYSG